MRWRILLYFLKPHRSLYGALLIATLFATVLESVSVVAVFPLLSSVIGEPGQEAGGVLKLITSMATILPFSDPIVSTSVLLIGLWSLKTLANLFLDGLTGYVNGKVLYQTRGRMMDRYLGASYQFFLDSEQGALIYNILLTPGHTASVLNTAIHGVMELLKVVALITLLFLISPFITLVIASMGLVTLGAIFVLSNRVSYRLGQRGSQAYMQQSIIANDLFRGILQIITFGTGKIWLEKFQRENRTLSTVFVINTIWAAIPRRLMELGAIALMLGIVLILHFTNPASLTNFVPTLGVFAMAMFRLLPAGANLGRMRMDFMTVFPDVEKAYYALAGPIPMRRTDGKVLKSFERVIAFEDVHFAHQDREALFEGLNLAIEKGKVTAIVGPSGAGKTTLINLILGLFEPTGGRITVDGVPLSDYTPESWLSKIGFVSQETFIYHATVTDNISFSKNGQSMESVVEAAKIANAHEFISELPQGYDTLVGDRGMKLSIGQQQRISIARAVLEGPELLIFDEATSSLDSISERLVQEAIDKVSKNHTVVLIAHRLSTIRNADKIIVLDNGRAVEEGNHQELLSRQGHYSRLVAASNR